MKTARESRREAKEASDLNAESCRRHISSKIEAAVADGLYWVDIYFGNDFRPDAHIQEELKTELESKGYSWSTYTSIDMRDYSPTRIRIDWSE